MAWFGIGPGRENRARDDVPLVEAVLASSALPGFYPPLLHVRPRVRGVDAFSFEHQDYLVEEGYRAARQALADAGESPPAAATG